MLADSEQTIYLADMAGDGLANLVRVRNGEVCYWPNTGFGRFGAKVTMDHSPWVDQPGHFDQRRVRLADIDGTGCADLVYLHPDGTLVYLNQSGNGYSEPAALPQAFPQLDSLAHVTMTDLLGHGTACLVWSSPLPGDAGRQVRYVDLMTAGKPYLLTGVVNNLGAETLISYAPSTKFYLADRAAGRPVDHPAAVPGAGRRAGGDHRPGQPEQVHHPARLPPRVLRRLRTRVPRVRHGRALGHRGSGRARGRPRAGSRTWTGRPTCRPSSPGRGCTRACSRARTTSPGCTPASTGASPAAATRTCPTPGCPRPCGRSGSQPGRGGCRATEAREACRALKGLPLREEVYALDGSEAEGRPYLVTEHNYTIELLQPAITPVPDGPQNYHAVLLTPRPRERHRALRAHAVPDGGRRAAGRPADRPRHGAGRG